MLDILASHSLFSLWIFFLVEVSHYTLLNGSYHFYKSLILTL